MEVKEQELQKPNLLIVDDDQRNKVGYTMYFEKLLGVPFDWADSAETALKELEKGNYSHIIVDGLRGRWKEVVVKAKELKIPNIFVYSGDTWIEDEVNETGAKFFAKGKSETYDKFKEIFSEKVV